MNNYMLKSWMITNTADAEITNIAFDRMKYFLTDIDSTVFVNVNDTETCERYLAAGIRMTTVPKDPVDQILGVLFYYKLNAIMEGRITVVETELSSSLGDNMVYIHSENEVAKDVDIPDWWTAADPLHCEVDLLDQDKVVTMHRHNLWRELDLGWPNEPATEPTGNIVFADFGRDETK
jgi:hypothetical protein